MNSPESPETPEAEGGNEVPRALRFTVIAMGFLLVGGLMLLFVGIAQKVMHGDTGPRGCQPLSIDLTGKGQVVRFDENEKEVIVWLKESPTSLSIRHYQPCTGKILRDVHVNADKLP